LWKHRVIRQSVLEEQDQVDLVALGKAKRKIQQIVETGRQRKHQSTRSKIARWDTAGRPSRQIAENQTERVEPRDNGISSAPEAPDSVSQPMPTPQDMDWEIGYIPLRHSDASAEEEQEVHHG
jgi:hypothetical protein